jgi:hypothetical protein
LPGVLQDIVASHINEAALAERGDIRTLNETLRDNLEQKGMVFNTTDPQKFRSALRAAGFYAEWKEKYGPEGPCSSGRSACWAEPYPLNPLTRRIEQALAGRLIVERLIKRVGELVEDRPGRLLWREQAVPGQHLKLRPTTRRVSPRRLPRSPKLGPGSTRSRVRARVEHVFGHQQSSMGGKIVRTIGIARARFKIGMMNLGYNIRRLVQLERMGAAPA